MAIKKSELYSSLWKSCDELRGGMDASQYKDYVLVLLFVKYVSDKYAGQPYAPIIVPDGGSFDDMKRAKGKPNIGEQMNTIVSALAEANQLKGVIDTADFDDNTKLGDGKEMQDRLTNLVGIFENPALDFSRNRAEGDDILGDAYEYLMRNFATQSGKSKGQFYTPAEVSRIMAQIIGLQNVTSPQATLYDPTCGSGSLLLKGADEVPDEVGGITLYGQEKDNSTRALAKMNMILHGNASATIRQGDTIANPLFLLDEKNLQRFDFALANPPFSYKSWSNGINPEKDQFDRFGYGLPPTKNGDYAFLQHFLKSLKSTGRGAIILPHGVLFRGNVESDIRERIIKQGFIKGIIGLPANLFYGTGIPACIIVIDKENAGVERGIFMIDASNGYVKDGNKNRLRHQDIHKIVDVFNNEIELPRYSRKVSFDEIEKNEFNLNIPRYIDTTEPEDIQDIEAHLLGGIPNRDLDALKRYWKVFPSVAEALFTPNERDDYSDLRVDASKIKTTIFQHPEFVNYSDRVDAVFEAWRTYNLPMLKGIAIGDKPKALIKALSEDLLERFADVPLIDEYDIYQKLMTYWSDVMQDDMGVLVVDGWLEGNRITEMRKIRDAINEAQLDEDTLAAQLNELLDVYGDKGEVLYPATYAGRFTEKRVTKLYNEAQKQNQSADEMQIITDCYMAFTAHEELAEKIATGRAKLLALLDETLIPKPLMIARYFQKELMTIEDLEADSEAQAQAMSDLEEEHGNEGGLLHEAQSDAGNLGKGSAQDRLKAIKKDPEFAEEGEVEMIERYLDYLQRESDLKDEIAEAKAQLDEKLIQTYPQLSEDEVKVLVVEDKWLATLETEVRNELDRISQALTTRIKELADRYAEPLHELADRADHHHQNVQAHLKKMGYSWNK